MVAATSASTFSDFAQSWSHISGYHATITVFEREGKRTDNRVLTYEFSKPSHAVMHVLSGKDAGATLTWNGGPTLIGKKGHGFMSMFTKTFRLHDPTVTTVRGSSIDELSYASILRHLEQNREHLKDYPSNVIDGAPTRAISFVATSPATDAGLSREEFIFSQNTHLPIRVLGFEGKLLVRQVDFSHVTFVPQH